MFVYMTRIQIQEWDDSAAASAAAIFNTCIRSA